MKRYEDPPKDYDSLPKMSLVTSAVSLLLRLLLLLPYIFLKSLPFFIDVHDHELLESF